MRFIAILVVSGLMFCGSACAEPPTLWLDVRSAQEYQAGHLDAAVNVPHTEIKQTIEVLAPDRSTPIVLYCRSGRRAGIALQYLKEMGYNNLTNARDQNGASVLRQSKVDP